jgi:formylglycine-generating enzyme required for sulfatase activity
MLHRLFPLSIVCGLVSIAVAAALPAEKNYTNAIGMELVRIEPGSFTMGFEGTALAEELVTEKAHFPNGDFDEHPTHQVRITQAFYMATCEVTNAQYEQFDPNHRSGRGRTGHSKESDEAVVFVSWHDAVAFCKWLSEKENLPYRLPTEAEWEYACRAGTSTAFHTGNTLPAEFVKDGDVPLIVGRTPPNPWGLYDMHGNVEEWCCDWYGPYEASPQTDPVGRADGDFKVTRGGSHSTAPYYLRSANRLGTVADDKNGLIGFRVVMGQMPGTQPPPNLTRHLYQTDVGQGIPPDIQNGPDPEQPYFHSPRTFVKMPSSNRGPLYSKHNHFTSVVECPNGDLLAIWHTCIGESGRELAVAASRLRYGRDEWEPASLFWDAPDRNDHGHAMWFDGKETIYHFNGLADLVRNVALVMRRSRDTGVTWSQPRTIADHGPSRMPVESVFQTKEGFYAISCDKGPNIVWISRDQGMSWTDPGGSIRGKHAAVVQLKDRRLMALGRERDIDGRMPMSISEDMGKTWQYSASEFPPITWGQRAVLLRLKEGPLFFASFCKKMLITNQSGKQHQVSGLFGAVSFDEGQTWPHKRLITDDRPAHDIETLNGELITMSAHKSESVGYLSVCQSADRLIHLLTSRQHYAFNLKWLLTPPPPAPLQPYERSDDPAAFAAVDPEKGFTVEIRTQLVRCSPDDKAVDIELYDGAGSRYAMAVTDAGVYWYEGYIRGSAFLPLDQFVPVAENLNNMGTMHTYRIAVRTDRVVQLYRDGKLIGVRPREYRTPRGAYIQLGAGGGAEALVEYLAYDLSGAFEPKPR